MESTQLLTTCGLSTKNPKLPLSKTSEIGPIFEAIHFDPDFKASTNDNPKPSCQRVVNK
jgi:hypothetical protein